MPEHSPDKIKRYSMIVTAMGIGSTKDTNGNWVKYEDYESELFKFRRIKVRILKCELATDPRMTIAKIEISNNGGIWKEVCDTKDLEFALRFLRAGIEMSQGIFIEEELRG